MLFIIIIILKIINMNIMTDAKFNENNLSNSLIRK